MSTTLIVLGGLPGTGKTTVGRALARRLGAVFLRIDSIEGPMLAAGWNVEGAGYAAAQAVAEDNLRLGNAVVADCVNPWPLTRAAWRLVAERAGVHIVEVEFVCSNTDAHRARVESRRLAEPDAGWPSWHDVLGRDYRTWEDPSLVIDTAAVCVDEAVARIAGAVREANETGTSAV